MIRYASIHIAILDHTIYVYIFSGAVTLDYHAQILAAPLASVKTSI